MIDPDDNTEANDDINNPVSEENNTETKDDNIEQIPYEYNSETKNDNIEQIPYEYNSEINDDVIDRMPQEEPQPYVPRTKKEVKAMAKRIRSAEKKAQKATKAAEKRLPRKERKALKAQRKIERKLERKAIWKKLPRFVKISSVTGYISFIIGAIALVCLAIGGGAYCIYCNYVNSMYEGRNNPVDQELIYEQSPIDTEGAEYIASLPGHPKDDTWAIYVYMVGSDLESYGEDDLSDLTYVLTSDEYSYNSTELQDSMMTRIKDFATEVSDCGMELPSHLFYTQKPEAYSTTLTQEVVVAEENGMGYNDIQEMVDASLPDNVEIVIQPGGSTRWSTDIINPNRTQRFLIHGGAMEEVENKPLMNMGSREGLADFLSFCKEGYSADHQILVLWDHGSASFGYGSDDIFGSMLTLKDIRDALGDVYAADADKPPFEIIGFDACLMSCAETAYNLDGYGQYLAASEEVAPGDGWDYVKWLDYLGENTQANSASVAQSIADSYMDYYVTQNINMGKVFGDFAAAFSVTDIHKGAQVYNKYGEVAGEIIRAAAEDVSVLGDVSRAAASSVRYGEDYYKYYNTIDLGMFLSYLQEDYDAAFEARFILNDAVIYHRENSYLTGSEGLSIYFPADIADANGLANMLEYIDAITDDQNIKTLYYYKIGGCLNEELEKYCQDQGYGTLKPMDTSALKKLSDTDVNLDGMNMSVDADASMTELMQDYYMTLAYYDQENDTVIEYGYDNYAWLDGEGHLVTEFDGKWVTLGGEPLALEIISQTDSSILYRTHILLDGQDAYLSMSYDNSTEEFTILGAVSAESVQGGDTLMRRESILDDGVQITPLYEALINETSSIKEGDSFRYSMGMKPEMKVLDNGTYLESFYIRDVRNDEYATPVVRSEIKNGSCQSAEIDKDWVVVYTD